MAQRWQGIVVASGLIIAGACTDRITTAPDAAKISHVSRGLESGKWINVSAWDSGNENACSQHNSDWLEVYVVNGGGQVLASGQVDLHAASRSLTLTGVSIADSTDEHIEIKFRKFDILTGGNQTVAVRSYYYTQHSDIWHVEMGWNPTVEMVCSIMAYWTRQATPAVAMVFVQPRYDTLFVGSSGVTYGARAYASDGVTEIFTNGTANWSSDNSSIVSVSSTSSGSGPFGYPQAVVNANNLGQTILHATRQGSTGGAQITVIPVNGGGGCGLPQC